MEFSRVTSGFRCASTRCCRSGAPTSGGLRRPDQRPVRSVGDGVVDFAGVQGGFGNVVFVKHRNNNVTVYGHLSRIDVKRGQSVSQSQVIGAVGATGWATGPHLHFEFRVNGVHQDPDHCQAERRGAGQRGGPSEVRGAGPGHRVQLGAAASMRLVTAE